MTHKTFCAQLCNELVNKQWALLRNQLQRNMNLNKMNSRKAAQQMKEKKSSELMVFHPFLLKFTAKASFFEFSLARDVINLLKLSWYQTELQTYLLYSLCLGTFVSSK